MCDNCVDQIMKARDRIESMPEGAKIVVRCDTCGNTYTTRVVWRRSLKQISVSLTLLALGTALGWLLRALIEG